jgi:hypothetical protein
MSPGTERRTGRRNPSERDRGPQVLEGLRTNSPPLVAVRNPTGTAVWELCGPSDRVAVVIPDITRPPVTDPSCTGVETVPGARRRISPLSSIRPHRSILT